MIGRPLIWRFLSICPHRTRRASHCGVSYQRGPGIKCRELDIKEHPPKPAPLPDQRISLRTAAIGVRNF
jgi:hypothetical protein